MIFTFLFGYFLCYKLKHILDRDLFSYLNEMRTDISLFLHEVFVTCSCYTPLSSGVFLRGTFLVVSHRGSLHLPVSSSTGLFLLKVIQSVSPTHAAQFEFKCVIFL